MLLIALFGLLILSSQNFWGLVDLPNLSVRVAGFNIYLLDVSYLIFLLFIFLAVLQGKNRRRNAAAQFSLAVAVRVPICIFLIYTVFLTFYSSYLGVSLNNCLRFITLVLPYVVYLSVPMLVNEENNFYKFLVMLYFFAVIALVVNLYQNITGWSPHIFQDLGDISSTHQIGYLYRTYNPSISLIMLLCLTLIMKVLSVEKGKVIIYYVLLAIASGALMLTFTRNIVIGYIVTILFIFTINAVFNRKSLGSKMKLILFSAMIFGTVAVLTEISPVKERLDQGVNEIAQGTGGYESRIELLEFAWGAISSGGMERLLFGVGYEGIARGDEEESMRYTPLYALQSGSDSGLAFLLFRFGLVGLIIFVLVTVAYVKEALKRFRLCNCREYHYYLLLGPALFVWAWVISFAGNMFFQHCYTIILITGMAISEIAYRLSIARPAPGYYGAVRNITK